MDASQITVENVASVVGVGIVAAWIAARKYLSQLQAIPPAKPTDVIVAGGAFMDMAPVKDILYELKRLADAAERIAEAAEASAEEDEIVRRAKAMAAEMVATEAQRRRPR